MSKFIERFKQRSEDGLTLIELIVGTFIMGLVSLLVMNIYMTTNNTANTVQKSTSSIADSQNATVSLTRDVRNARAIKISEAGNRLDVEKIDGTCVSWVYKDGSLYWNETPEESEDWDSDWPLRFSGAELINPGFFTPISHTGLTYGFTLSSGGSKTTMDGESYLRLSSGATESPCFGDGPATEEPPEEEEPPATSYAVTYTLNGGSVAGNPISYYATTAAFTLNNPTKTGFTFSGWTGTGLSTPTLTVTVAKGSTGARAYTANWVVVPTYAINYALNGGTASNLTEYTSLTPSFTLANPSRSGYTFDGWSGTDIAGKSNSVTIPVGSSGVRNYTANWIALPASNFEGKWDQTNTWNGSVQGNFSYKNTSGSSVSTVKVRLTVAGATSAPSGNMSCSYEGNNTFTCITPSWGSPSNGNWSSTYYSAFAGPGISGSGTVPVTILSVVKNS